MDNNELVPIIIDLNIVKTKQLNESWLTMFGGAVKMILKGMFGGGGLASTPSLRNLSVKGSPSQVAAFGDALANEKRYMDSFMKHGLADSGTLTSRHRLEAAIGRFERETGLKWPFT